MGNIEAKNDENKRIKMKMIRYQNENNKIKKIRN